MVVFSSHSCYNFNNMSSYHSQTIEQVLLNLETSEVGLTVEEAKKRLAQIGLNKISVVSARVTRLKIFISQWKSPLLLILLVAGVLSGFLREFIDMIVILLTAFLNSIIGFVQEDKANRALEKLRNMVEFRSLVLRGGIKMMVKSEELVPGDILFLESGDKIQADARLIETKDLEINESALTGESKPIKKQAHVVREDAVVGDRVNIAHRGTAVINGRAKAVVVATGKNTEIGKIATMIQKIEEEPTPLQTQLNKMSKVIGISVVCISLFIFILGVLLRSGQYDVFQMFETAVAIAVGAIPEGLVISLTVILAVGTQYILKRKSLVRKLVAAETLGSVSVICVDKTGTLTEGNMRVNRVLVSKEELYWHEVTGLNFHNPHDEEKHIDIALALRVGILANDALLINPEAVEAEWQFVGDTTDIALIYAGMKIGLEKNHLDAAVTRVAEIPFDSRNKYLAALYHRFTKESAIYVKGAFEVLISKCEFYEEGGEKKKLTIEKKNWFIEKEKEMAANGFRVLATAYHQVNEFTEKLEPSDLHELVLVGLIALSDPIRPEVKQTIASIAQAGIKTIMITGDHLRTAQFIASELGLPHGDDQIITGEKLENMSDAELQEAVKHTFIFARVDPAHKIRIVAALQANGEVVAMTGDGVNDAPALKGADIGIALGSGTDVAKEISDMVLLDNNFQTIVAAIEEGRRIYQNIRKVVLYLLASSFSEVILILGSIIANLPLALLPVQILWINLIEEALPSFALAFDPGDKENMLEKPRSRGANLIDSSVKTMVFMISLFSNLILFGLFLYFLNTTGDVDLTRTLVFASLGISALFYIFSIRNQRKMIWQYNPFQNYRVNLAVMMGWFLIVVAVYFPPLQLLLRTVPLAWGHWAVLLGFGLLNVLLIEAVKAGFLWNGRINSR